MSDLVLGAIMLKGTDPFKSGKKIRGEQREVKDLSDPDLAEYIKLFVGNTVRYPINAVILHDGLSESFISAHTTPRLSFVRVDVDEKFPNYERRFFAFWQYLDTRVDDGRVWLVDVNDIAFTEDPFGWLQTNWGGESLFIGTEWTIHKDNGWFQESSQYLPARYGQSILGEWGDEFPLNCGAWGGLKKSVLRTLESMLKNLDELKTHLEANPPPFPLMLDMWAFGMAVFADTKSTLLEFRMDGKTEYNGIPSPLIHDRQQSLQVHQERLLLGEPIPDLLRAKIRHIAPLPGWCSFEKAEALARLVYTQKLSIGVEVGVFGGRSLIPQALAMQQNKHGTLYAIDPYSNQAAIEGEINPEYDRYWADLDLADVFTTCCNAISALGLWRYLRWLNAPSQSCAGMFADQSVDILHIDGNHSPVGAARDVSLYFAKVRRGGWVVFDDADWSTVRPALVILDATCTLEIDAGGWRLYRKK